PAIVVALDVRRRPELCLELREAGVPRLERLHQILGAEDRVDRERSLERLGRLRCFVAAVLLAAPEGGHHHEPCELHAPHPTSSAAATRTRSRRGGPLR